MASKIKRYHWALEKLDYQAGLAHGKFQTSWPRNLSLKPLLPGSTSAAFFLSLLTRIPWGWENKDINKEPALSERLAKPGTQLVLLHDNDKTIGFALLADPDISLMQRFGYAARGQKVKEIEDLALFPEEAGQGRGKAFFEMFFARLFQDYDVVYWSQASSNHPHLYNYYTRMGMTLLAKDEESDFRFLHQ
ncbi:MAG: GNAT family N-acetyltransferase [Alphaproteobacteria bacterium]|nr:GNAT family N-acetyltransferase [Alphaproteobacteria bacterium]